ncbi:MAG: DUF1573 domain-containing protein [Gemmataceae bacterium]|nr:DUF1573 domain-containing protein [Gemmataceae bacterium]
MPRYVFLVLAVLLAGGAAGTAWVASLKPEPRGFYPKEPSHDFGEVDQGAILHHRFDFVNRLGEPLTIKNIIPSCGCSTGEWKHGTLAPGEIGSLEADWKVGGMRGPSKVIVTLVAERPNREQVATRATMTAMVRPDIEYSPPSLEFSSAGKQRISFAPGVMREFKLIGAACGHRAFAAKVCPDAPHEVEVAFDPSVWDRDLDKTDLRVETTSPNEAVCRIQLLVRKQ